MDTSSIKTRAAREYSREGARIVGRARQSPPEWAVARFDNAGNALRLESCTPRRPVYRRI